MAESANKCMHNFKKRIISKNMVLNIVTFNIRCFGFDGNYFAKGRSESRLKYIKDFVAYNYPDTDVFIFQEIMDLSILNLILPDGFKFHHYTHDYPRHMHIVLACKKEFDFTDVKIIPNTALDKTTSRPVIYGKLVENNISIAHIIGVHLKSGYEHANKRIQQCQTASQFISELIHDHKSDHIGDLSNELIDETKTRLKSLPIIMAGDFNSHYLARTKKDQDDLSYFEKIFKNQLKLTRHNKSTYILPDAESQLDHFWVSRGDVKTLEVYDLTKYTPANSLKNYYHDISDHLPVKIKIEI